MVKSNTKKSEKIEENPTLGKRHNYDASPEKGMKMKATELGFSHIEIKQIENLYLKKAKLRKL